MANIIKIKRSTITASPTSLAEGELAYSENSNNLFIGTSGANVTVIGGTEGIADTVSSMFSGGTQSGLTVTYDDSDNTLDLNVNDPTVTLTGAVTGSATMTNLGNVSITTTATSDPTITLAGDLSGSATLTNLGDATLTATVGNSAIETAMVNTNVITGQTALAANPDADNDFLLIYDSSATSFKKVAAKYVGANALAELDNVGSDTATSGNLMIADGSAWQTVAMSGDVLISSAGVATIQANSVALGTDTTGTFVGAGAVSGVGLSGSLSAEGGTFTVTSNATDANTAATIVARDASGNFSAGTITANLTGNITGDTTLGGTVGIAGNVSVNTNKFNVTALTGNTAIAGTLGVEGAVDINAVADISDTLTCSKSTGTGLSVSANAVVGGNLSVTGNLSVDGTLTSINSTTVTVDDKNIELGSTDTPTDSTADGGGITLKGATDKSIIWDNANENWTLNQDVNVPTGKVFRINNASVLSATTLGSSVVGSSLTSVGTIGTGTWQGDTVGVGYGGTGLASFTSGDIMYASGATTISKLAKGTAGQTLQMNADATAPEWTNTIDGGTF